MDFTQLITIIVAVAIIYLIIKFIVSPIIKVIAGVIIFLLFAYILHRFGFDFNKILSPLGISLDVNGWINSISWIFAPVNYFIDQAKNFLLSIWENINKK